MGPGKRSASICHQDESAASHIHTEHFRNKDRTLLGMGGQPEGIAMPLKHERLGSKNDNNTAEVAEQSNWYMVEGHF